MSSILEHPPRKCVIALVAVDRADCATCWKTLLSVSHAAGYLAPLGVCPSQRRPARPGSLAEGTKREASHALILLSPVHNDGFHLERRQTTELEFEKDQDSRMEAAYVTGIVQTLIPGQPQVVRMG